MKLLAVTRHSPLPENDGAGAYLFDLLSYLSKKGVHIEVVWISSEDSLRKKNWWKVPPRFLKVADLKIIGCLSVGPWRYFKWGLLTARAGGFINKFRPAMRNRTSSGGFAPAPLASPVASSPPANHIPGWSDPPSHLETRFFLKRLKQFRPDAILVNYCWLTPLLEGLPSHLKTAILTSDVVSQRLAPNPNRVPDPGTPAGETALLKGAKHILAISEDDAAVFRGWLPDHSVLLTPKAATITPLNPASVDPFRILFVGGMNNYNREGLAWFLNEVWPSVLGSQPQARLHICGAIGSTVSVTPEGVLIKGRVADLTAEYASAAIAIVPLLNGTGVKIKLVEAAGFGKPIVTTPVGLQGLGFLRGSVCEAATANQFSEAIMGLLASGPKREELSLAVCRAVQVHLSIEACYRPFWEALTANGERGSPALYP